MAQTTVLVAAQTAATSDPIVIAAGSTVTIGLFSASKIPEDYFFPVMMETPGADLKIFDLSDEKPAQQATGPATLTILRPSIAASGINVGAFVET